MEKKLKKRATRTDALEKTKLHGNSGLLVSRSFGSRLSPVRVV